MNKKEYMKLYRERNKEKILAQAREYKETHKEQVKAKQKEYSITQADKIKEYRHNYIRTPEYKELRKLHDKKYYEANKDKLTEKMHEYYKANRESMLEKSREWKRENPRKVRFMNLKRLLFLKDACVVGEEVRYEDILTLLAKQDHKCFYCGKDLDVYHVDHYIPLSKGGKHIVENLRISCPPCNLSKWNKMPEQFIKQFRQAV